MKRNQVSLTRCEDGKAQVGSAFGPHCAPTSNWPYAIDLTLKTAQQLNATLLLWDATTAEATPVEASTLAITVANLGWA